MRATPAASRRIASNAVPAVSGSRVMSKNSSELKPDPATFWRTESSSLFCATSDRYGARFPKFSGASVRFPIDCFTPHRTRGSGAIETCRLGPDPRSGSVSNRERTHMPHHNFPAWQTLACVPMCVIACAPIIMTHKPRSIGRLHPMGLPLATAISRSCACRKSPNPIPATARSAARTAGCSLEFPACP